MIVESDWVSLSEVVEFSPRFLGGLESDDPISFLSMSSVTTEGDLVGEEERRYSEVCKGYTPFENGDLLVAKITPCFENGKIAQADLKHRFGFGSTEFHVLRPDPKRLNSRYLLHFLRQEYIRVDGARKMTGSAGHRRVPVSFFHDLKIFLPPLEEQRRIADILDGSLRVCHVRMSTVEKLRSLEQAFFLDMFGCPVSNLSKRPTLKLGEVGRLDRGVSKHRPRNAPELLGGNYPLIQTGEISRCDGYITNYSATYSDVGLLQSKMWPAGTLCITIAANIAKTGILTFDACFPDSVVGFTADDSATVEYVRVWMSFLQENLEANAPSSAQKNINLAILRDLDIPLPSLLERQLFSEKISSLRKLKDSNRRHLLLLNALFASLQHRAFRGEL